MIPFKDKVNRQWAPWPGDLEALVVMWRYRPGWRFVLVDEERDPASTHGASAGGLTLEIVTKTSQSHDPKICEECKSPVTDYRVRFLYPVPPATFDRQTWMDWIMDCVEQTELHEARENVHLEWTEYVDGNQIKHVEHPFAPNHGPGRDPYRRYSYATDEQRRTSFTGVVKDSVEDA